MACGVGGWVGGEGGGLNGLLLDGWEKGGWDELL